MKGHSADRRWGFWLADHGLPMGGLVLLAVGAATSWWAMSLGSAALAIAFFAWVAEADGLLALPRPGRVAIRRGSGFETPLSFKVRRGERVLLFVREDDPERGWSDVYTVRDRPKGTDGFEPYFSLPLTITGWSLRGRVPVEDLRFEHHERSTYVTRGSLERSLSAAGM